MNNENQTYNQIEAYLNGKLSDVDRALFEKSISIDPEIQAKIRAHQLANLLVKKNSLLEIKNLIAQEDALARKSNLVKGLVIGLLFASLGILGWWIYSNKETVVLKKSSNQDFTKQLPLQKETGLAEILQKEEQIIQPISKTSTQVATNFPKEELENIAETSVNNLIQSHPAQTDSVRPIEKKEQSTLFEDLSVLKSEETKVDVCERTVIDAFLTIFPACPSEHNGSIQVSGFKGGKSPYTVEYYDGEGKGQISSIHLSMGNYFVVVKDANECIKKFENVQVKEMDCNKEFSLNPFIGDVWEIPSYAYSGTLTIYDEVGIVYFKTEIAAGATEKWLGYSSKGELKTGYFPFTIKYQDGFTKDGGISIGK